MCVWLWDVRVAIGCWYVQRTRTMEARQLTGHPSPMGVKRFSLGIWLGPAYATAAPLVASAFFSSWCFTSGSLNETGMVEGLY